MTVTICRGTKFCHDTEMTVVRKGQIQNGRSVPTAGKNVCYSKNLCVRGGGCDRGLCAGLR